jgi:hypothetical protein
MQHTVQRLGNDIRALERKISILDKIAFSSEQDCKRIEQQLQQLIDKKNRIKKLIATMLSDDNEDYTKLKAIVKESVKAVLSDNKTLISTAFAALLQTLKTDPQMVKLIQNIPSAADDDNDSNNITKYFEINRHSILNLGEKNYENLVEALAINAIDTASASSNPISSLPQSSSPTFSNLSNQTHTRRKEDPETYHNSKGDIAD